MDKNASEVLQYIEDNDVKFIRLAFCDFFGVQKNISVMPSQMHYAFDRGISLSSGSISYLFGADCEELYLRPDPSTLSILPWRPMHGKVVRLFCDIVYPDGRPFECDSRNILKKTAARAREKGLFFSVDLSNKFYLFELDDKGNPTDILFDNASICDIAPLDKGENVRREICLTLEDMGIIPENSHHAEGHGQNEICFRNNSILSAADNLITFRTVVNTVASRHGLYALFDNVQGQPDNNAAVRISAVKDDENIFDINNDDGKTGLMIAAGIINRFNEISLFINSKIKYSRKNLDYELSVFRNRGIRSCMEIIEDFYKSNPYLVFTLILEAALEGMENNSDIFSLDHASVALSDDHRLRSRVEVACSPEIISGMAKPGSFINKVIPSEISGAYIDKFSRT